MGRYLTITQNYKPGYKKRTISPSFSIGPVSLKFILITILSLSALFYLFQMNQRSLKGYEFKKLEDTKKKLILENEQLKAEAARLQSLEVINQEGSKLVPPGKIDYLPVKEEMAKH